jgi:hypothetical protein
MESACHGKGAEGNDEIRMTNDEKEIRSGSLMSIGALNNHEGELVAEIL